MENDTLHTYRAMSGTDHDQNIKFNKKEVQCYSKKQLKKLYPNGDYKLVGETRTSKKKAVVSRLKLGEQVADVSVHGCHNRLLNKCVGFARVGADEFVALQVSRIPFLIILACAIVALGTTSTVMVTSMVNPPSYTPSGPVVIAPDHPMPSQDVNAEANEGDNSEKAEVEKGGGSLSLSYSLDAKLDLDTGKIDIYVKNPKSSTHDMSVILYLVSGETEVAIAQSGRVSAGYSLKTMELVEGTATLSEGVYTGYYLLSLFDPETGERALVQPKIAGVELVVYRSTADE